MKVLNCPSCGAEVTFQSAHTVFTVCKYCQSTLVRKDLKLEDLGKMAQLKDDPTPLQLGTSGKRKGEFTLIGRVRVEWERGFWNEWYLRFDDGREGWLADAQGFYMLSLPTATPAKMPTPLELRPGLPIEIDHITFSVDDIKDVTYTFAEGELPFAAPQGFKGRSIDLRHGENDFASISFGAGGDVDVFVGHYFEFEDFQFHNLRVIDGW